MKTAIVVLNWNRSRETVACLESLLPTVARSEAMVICCDNGSSDDSIAVLLDWAGQNFVQIARQSATQNPAFVLIATGANLGYAGGNNVGIRYVLTHTQCEYIWILNNDTVIVDGALEELLRCAAQKPHVAAFGSTLIHDQDTVECAGGYRFYPALTVVTPVFGGKPLGWVMEQKHTPRLDYVSGAAMLLRRVAVEQVGLLNEKFFLYYEELDYAHRLRAQGFVIDWCSRAMVRHEGGTSTGSRRIERGAGSWIANYHENLSTLRYLRLHHPWVLPFAAAFRLAAKLATITLFRRWAALKPLMTAYRDFLLSTACTAEHRSPYAVFEGVLPTRQTA